MVLTVFVWGESAGVYVDVRVDLDGGHVQAAGLEDRTDAAGDDSFTNARDDPTGHQDVLHRSPLESSMGRRKAKGNISVHK